MSWLREFWPWLLGAFTVCTVLFILYTLFFSNRPTVRQYTYKETPRENSPWKCIYPGTGLKMTADPPSCSFLGVAG